MSQSKKTPNRPPVFSIIGSGSWATALLKILEHNGYQVKWWIRQNQDLESIQEHQRNPKYMGSLAIDLSKVTLTNQIKEAVQDADIVLLAVPSFFLENALRGLSKKDLKNKLVVSTIKGIIPSGHQLVTDYLNSHFGVLYENLVVLSGPSHAEEVAYGRMTYLTIGSHSKANSDQLCHVFKTDYLNFKTSEDITGIEYTAVFKNIYAIISGISNSMGYGDNFQAVLVNNALKELAQMLDAFTSSSRNIMDSVYMGDLLVTAYSQFSRNRTFGNMLGKGYSKKAALMEMNMVPEGYYAVQPAYELVEENNVNAPIVAAAFRIIHENISPGIEIRILEDKLE
ncbi:MAG: glycerol-3-phosphate dehydrogenase [Bacteroidetes bacterium SW_10_40_5]|nr:MAG: glycerol-3-phosphate dehydrogenase [Bacteroidetes bacterium SW_10_40_5]